MAVRSWTMYIRVPGTVTLCCWCSHQMHACKPYTCMHAPVHMHVHAHPTVQSSMERLFELESTSCRVMSHYAVMQAWCYLMEHEITLCSLMLGTLAVTAWHMLLYCTVCYTTVYIMQHAATLRGIILQHVVVSCSMQLLSKAHVRAQGESPLLLLFTAVTALQGVQSGPPALESRPLPLALPMTPLPPRPPEMNPLFLPFL